MVVLTGSMDLTLVIVGLVVLFGVGGVSWYAWRRRAALRAAASSSKVDWDPDAALRQRVRHSDELSALYASLGYDLDVEAQAVQLVEALKETIRTEIPDFRALWSALTSAPLPKAPALPLPGQSNPEPHPAERLLHAVIEAGPDEQRVRRLLDRAPMEEPVPYAEVLPVMRDGAITWRPAVEVTLVRKRPADPERFLQLLGHVETLVRTSPLERSAQPTEAFEQAIVNVRTALGRPEANLPLAITALEEHLLRWLHRAHLQEQYARKQALDAFLRSLVTLRHTCVAPLRAGEPLKAGTLAACNQQVQALTATYLGTPWMQVPHLTILLLTTFLELKLSGYSQREQADPSTPAGVLRLVHNEIASGYYVSNELLRRLRQQEGRGLYVHSLVHALLHISGA